MRKTFIILILVAAGLCLAASCGGSGDPHCRIYLVADSSGTFDELHVVESPADGNWGPDLLLEPAEYLTDYPDWRIFRFPAGKNFDLRMPYTIGTRHEVKEVEDNSCGDGKGVKYEISGGNLFTTYFTFEH